jgi:TnpA family transposase
VRRLPALSRRRVKDRPLLPREVDAELVPAMWKRAVFSNGKLPPGAVDRDAYVVCVLEQLHRALNRRDVFASPSNRWADPRARLLDGPRWEAMRADVLAGLSLTEDAGEHLAQLTRGLDAAWRQMADRLQEAGDDAKVEIVVPEDGGRAKLSVDKLGAVGEPESLTWLKNTTEAMLPRIELPDLLFEVHSWTGFLDAFGHVSERRTRMEGLLVSLVALLVSQSCNIGLTPVIDTENKALTRSRLSHVDQNYVRADTIATANAALITTQSRIELAQMWGGGLLASVDGLRFIVPVKSINTGPSPKYYGYKRGVTWLNAVNDQVAGIGAMVVRGTPRDSLYTLDTLLNLDGGVKPEMVATDNASYSDMAFGLYKMLGFRFAPRFRDLEDQRFWRADLPDGEAPTAGYGPLEAVACNKVNLKRIATHWPDMLRVAGSLITNQVGAYDLLRMFGRQGHPTPLALRSPSTGGSTRPAPARAGRPGRRHLPAADEPTADRAGVPPPSRPRHLPWRPGPDPAGIPRGPGGPVGQSGSRAQCRRALEHPLLGRGRRPAPRRGPRHQGRASPACPRSRTGTSTSWAATCSISRPVAPARAFAPSGTRMPSRTTKTRTDGTGKGLRGCGSPPYRARAPDGAGPLHVPKRPRNQMTGGDVADNAFDPTRVEYRAKWLCTREPSPYEASVGTGRAEARQAARGTRRSRARARGCRRSMARLPRWPR